MEKKNQDEGWGEGEGVYYWYVKFDNKSGLLVEGTIGKSSLPTRVGYWYFKVANKTGLPVDQAFQQEWATGRVNYW